MTTISNDDLRARLCWYDERNPLPIKQMVAQDNPCKCPSCNQGTHPLADELLRLREERASGVSHITPIGGNIFSDLGFSDDEAAELQRQARAALAATEAPPERCEHEWVSGNNQYVTNCLVCRKCHAIKPEKQP